MQHKNLILSAITIVALVAIALYQYTDRQRLAGQLDQQTDLRQQLLEQVELNTVQRLDFENQIENLESNLLATANRITNLSAELQEARENADPNLQQMREDLRADIEQELREDPDQLSRLMQRESPEQLVEVSARMQVSSAYTEFLNSLNIDDNRLDSIEEALLEVMRQRSLASMRSRSGDGEPAADQSVFSPDYMFEQLSPLLTLDEQDLFAEYEAELPERQRRNGYNSQIVMMAPGLGESSRNRLADLLMDNIPSVASNIIDPPQGNYVDRQLAGLDKVEQLVAEEFEAGEIREVMNFISQQKASMELVRAMTEQRQQN